MSEQQSDLTVHWARKLRELWRAQAQVRRLKQELRSELRMPGVTREIPEFLTRLSRTAFHRRSERAAGAAGQTR